MARDNWIVCIAYNNAHLTKNAVTSFLAQDIGDVRVLLLNNASRDNTAAWMATCGPAVFGVHFGAQRSVAACWNFGLDWCFAHGAERVLVCNNDVELRPETYRLLDADSGPFVTAVGVNSREQMAEALEPEKRRPRPDFSCYLIRRWCFESLRFDEEYKIAFAEDARYHAELHRLGIQANCIGVPFYHIGSATVKHADPEEQERIGKQADQNRQLFYRTYGENIGTPGYDNLFTPETFGISTRV